MSCAVTAILGARTKAVSAHESDAGKRGVPEGGHTGPVGNLSRDREGDEDSAIE